MQKTSITFGIAASALLAACGENAGEKTLQQPLQQPRNTSELAPVPAPTQSPDEAWRDFPAHLNRALAGHERKRAEAVRLLQHAAESYEIKSRNRGKGVAGWFAATVTLESNAYADGLDIALSSGQPPQKYSAPEEVRVRVSEHWGFKYDAADEQGVRLHSDCWRFVESVVAVEALGIVTGRMLGRESKLRENFSSHLAAYHALKTRLATEHSADADEQLYLAWWRFCGLPMMRPIDMY